MEYGRIVRESCFAINKQVVKTPNGQLYYLVGNNSLSTNDSISMPSNCTSVKIASKTSGIAL